MYIRTRRGCASNEVRIGIRIAVDAVAGGGGFIVIILAEVL
jgi:hypothetical protein